MCVMARKTKMTTSTAETGTSTLTLGRPPKDATRGGYGGPFAMRAWMGGQAAVMPSWKEGLTAMYFS